MSFYVMIIALLSLIGICGTQFLYLLYIERMDKERRKRLAELERKCNYLMEKLKQTEAKLHQQEAMINDLYEEDENINDSLNIFEIEVVEDEQEEEIWADIIEDNSNPRT
ncbi:MAG: hypothetical protein D6735_06970 [Acidobacteria bacterium]|nr:MAG: hypothetical protein D6735_06970 [Acidobacteriota bacterium]